MKINKINTLIKIILFSLTINFSNTFSTSFSTQFQTSLGTAFRLPKKPPKDFKLKNDNLNLFQVKETETSKLANRNTNKNTNKNKGIFDSLVKPLAKKLIKDEEKNIKNTQNTQQKNYSIKTLPDKPKYAEGWIKYFTYDENGKYKPKRFFLNDQYDRESRVDDLKKFPEPDSVK